MVEVHVEVHEIPDHTSGIVYELVNGVVVSEGIPCIQPANHFVVMLKRDAFRTILDETEITRWIHVVVFYSLLGNLEGPLIFCRKKSILNILDISWIVTSVFHVDNNMVCAKNGIKAVNNNFLEIIFNKICSRDKHRTENREHLRFLTRFGGP